MLKTRRRMEFFAFYDDQGIARHLEPDVAEGVDDRADQQLFLDLP